MVGWGKEFYGGWRVEQGAAREGEGEGRTTRGLFGQKPKTGSQDCFSKIANNKHSRESRLTREIEIQNL